MSPTYLLYNTRSGFQTRLGETFILVIFSYFLGSQTISGLYHTCNNRKQQRYSISVNNNNNNNNNDNDNNNNNSNNNNNNNNDDDDDDDDDNDNKCALFSRFLGAAYKCET